MSQATRIIRTAGLGSVSQHAKPDEAALAPRNLGATGAGSEDGLFLEGLPAGTVVQADTANHSYRIRMISKTHAEISGHERYCPDPVLVRLTGTQWLDSSISQCYVARGLQLEFVDSEGVGILTSPITRLRISQLGAAAPSAR